MEEFGVLVAVDVPLLCALLDQLLIARLRRGEQRDRADPVLLAQGGQLVAGGASVRELLDCIEVKVRRFEGRGARPAKRVGDPLSKTARGRLERVL